MLEIIVCILAGLGAGFGTGFAGMSAAVVISPMLIIFLNVNVYEAIGISLASDVLASAVCAYTYGKNKNIDIKKSKSLLISVLLFTVIGAIISHLSPTVTIGNMTLFFTFILGINFFLKSFRDKKNVKEFQLNDFFKKFLPILCGIVIGFICGFIGAGGGMMMLFLLTTVLGYSLKKAVGTSVFIMTFTALLGSCSHFYLENVIPDLKILFTCMISTFCFAMIASRFANKVDLKILNRITGIVLMILGISLIVFEYFI